MSEGVRNIQISDEASTLQIEIHNSPKMENTNDDILSLIGFVDEETPQQEEESQQEEEPQQEEEENTVYQAPVQIRVKKCRFFNTARGCSKGENCNFLHKKNVCAFFLTDKGCVLKDCPFIHDKNQTSSVVLKTCPQCDNYCIGKQCRDCHNKMKERQRSHPREASDRFNHQASDRFNHQAPHRFNHQAPHRFNSQAPNRFNSQASGRFSYNSFQDQMPRTPMRRRPHHFRNQERKIEQHPYSNYSNVTRFYSDEDGYHDN
jgi:hypothetical protein